MCFTQNFWSLLVLGLADGFLYALIALGYTLVYGVLQLINFAHSEIFMIGGFASYFALNALIGTSTPHGAASVWYTLIGIGAGAAAGGALAFLLERVAYRPLRRRNAPRLAFLISAIGASYFLFNLAGKEFGRFPDTIPAPFNLYGTVFTIFGAPVTEIDLVIAISATLMMIFLDRVVAITRLGKSIRAVAEDQEMASLMGVNIDRVIWKTFVIGGALGGVAGFLFGLQYGVVYTMGFIPALKAFTAAVLGGIGSIRGAMLGGLVLGVFENLSVSCIPTEWRDTNAFLLLLIVLIVRPTGILGEQLGRSA